MPGWLSLRPWEKAKPPLGAVGQLLLKPPVPGRPGAWEQRPGQALTRFTSASPQQARTQTVQRVRAAVNEEAQRSRVVSHAVRQGLAEGVRSRQSLSQEPPHGDQKECAGEQVTSARGFRNHLLPQCASSSLTAPLITWNNQPSAHLCLDATNVSPLIEHVCVHRPPSPQTCGSAVCAPTWQSTPRSAKADPRFVSLIPTHNPLGNLSFYLQNAP